MKLSLKYREALIDLHQIRYAHAAYTFNKFLTSIAFQGYAKTRYIPVITGGFNYEVQREGKFRGRMPRPENTS
ncbi:hypothetical protein BH11PSE12_BH11PSE12_23960 [soil metagenome]